VSVHDDNYDDDDNYDASDAAVEFSACQLYMGFTVTIHNDAINLRTTEHIY